MHHASCHVVYLDRRARKDRHAKAGGSRLSNSFLRAPEFDEEQENVQTNLRSLLRHFHGVHICSSGRSCLAKIRELEADKEGCMPILLFIDVDFDHEPAEQDESSIPAATISISSPPSHETYSTIDGIDDSDDYYGLGLIKHINAEMSLSNLSRLLVPIAMTPDWAGPTSNDQFDEHLRLPWSPDHTQQTFLRPDLPSDRHILPVSQNHEPVAEIEHRRMLSCLEAGATDIIVSPMSADQVQALLVHAYRAHVKGVQDQAQILELSRRRKRSWVGVDEDKPFAYLRESMVSSLMSNICKPESMLKNVVQRRPFAIPESRERLIVKAIGEWGFSAHEFSDDELVHAAFLMLEHALQMPELETWRLPADVLKDFLWACRAAYNSFVLYHNFRHVIDVLQAVFYFLLELRILPPYPNTSSSSPRTEEPVSPIAALLRPFDALTLLIAAVGHDVGHPGVNNAFLVALKAPLAQLYNDNSVLEAFHCAAYSQILRRYWNVTFEDIDMRRLLIKSILATDMQVHFKYMTDLGNLQEKLHHNEGTDGWNIQALEEYKTLACGLLIKCADISNVARPFDIAAKWADVLQLEFARQGEMENDVGIPTTLFGGPPELGNMTKLANSQIGFMNIFACPLFEAVTDIMPGMRFAVSQIKANQEVWKRKIDQQKPPASSQSEGDRHQTDGFRSPRSGSPQRTGCSDQSFITSPETSHPEAVPAVHAFSPAPQDLPLRTSQSVPGFSPRRSPYDEALANHFHHQEAAVTEAVESNSLTRDGSEANVPSHEAPANLSRHSSGAFPPANMLSTGLSSRRSSNVMPSQLHLSMGSPSQSVSSGTTTQTTENHQPRRWPSDNQTTSSIYGVTEMLPNGHGHRTANGTASIRTGSDGSTTSSRPIKVDYNEVNYSRPQQHSSSSRPYSARQSAPPSSAGRHSGLSLHDRYSATTSAAQTFSSAVLPTSPADTQATSFLTDGSSVGGSNGGSNGGGRGGSGNGSVGYTSNHDVLAPRLDRLVAAIPHEKAGKFRSVGQTISREHPPLPMDEGGKTLKPSVIGRGHVSDERLVRRKTSRFRFDFWKRRKEESASP